MKKFYFLVFSLAAFIQATAQIDFKKLQQEYSSRRPFLDSMQAFPAVPYDSLKVVNTEGITISFWWMPHEKSKGTALLVHGFMMNKSHMLPRSKVYYDLGYNVIVMDLRARGESGGQATTSGPEISSDVIAVMDYYSNHLKGYGPLILVGYSHGGRAVAFAAEQKRADVKAIILESIPYSLVESFKRTYKIDPPPIPEGNISEAFKAISETPILLMMGDRDDAITEMEAQKIKGGYQNPTSQLIVFKGAGHDLSIEKHKPLYIKSINDFLNITMK
jgi:pimeloyl-ACP methyl ester carboxylesterase